MSQTYERIAKSDQWGIEILIVLHSDRGVRKQRPLRPYPKNITQLIHDKKLIATNKMQQTIVEESHIVDLGAEILDLRISTMTDDRQQTEIDNFQEKFTADVLTHGTVFALQQQQHNKPLM